MLIQIQEWFKTRNLKAEAINRAIAEFKISRSLNPMGGYILHIGEDETVVRVMYFTNQIPPNRAWFAVSNNGNNVRELSYDDVHMFETAWR